MTLWGSTTPARRPPIRTATTVRRLALGFAAGLASLAGWDRLVAQPPLQGRLPDFQTVPTSSTTPEFSFGDEPTTPRFPAQRPGDLNIRQTSFRQYQYGAAPASSQPAPLLNSTSMPPAPAAPNMYNTINNTGQIVAPAGPIQFPTAPAYPATAGPVMVPGQNQTLINPLFGTPVAGPQYPSPQSLPTPSPQTPRPSPQTPTPSPQSVLPSPQSGGAIGGGGLGGLGGLGGFARSGAYGSGSSRFGWGGKTHRGLLSSLALARSSHGSLKAHLQDCMFGYPQYFQEPPLGYYLNEGIRVQNTNADIHKFTLYRSDFQSGLDKLSPTGAARLNQMATRLQGWGGPILIEWTPEDPNLAEARKGQILTMLQTAGVWVGPERFTVGPPPSMGLQGIDADSQYNNGLTRYRDAAVNFGLPPNQSASIQQTAGGS